MQELIERVFTDPTFMWVGLVVAIMLTLAIFKKLFKVVGFTGISSRPLAVQGMAK